MTSRWVVRVLRITAVRGRSMKIGKWKLFATGALSVAALVGGAAPAYAGTDIPPTYGTDSGQGAGGKFVSDGDVVHACDLKLDDMRAHVQLWKASGPLHLGNVEDTEKDGECVTKTIDVPEGTRVFIRVGRWSAATGSGGDCRTSAEGVA
jgi:hypothetical protein